MGLPSRLKRLFPLRSIEDVVNLFKAMLDSPSAPDLTLSSILLGYLENVLCVCIGNNVAGGDSAGSDCESQNSSPEEDFPTVNVEEINALYSQFVALIRGSVDLSGQEIGSQRRLNRALVKRISDVIWNTLHRSYGQDKPHLQSIFSYLTGNKLDCFGLAYTTVAACQILNLNDVRLCLSEDHAWIIYVDALSGRDETAEVTWHGKIEDRRGQPISLAERSWLYLNGHAIECTRYTEVAAAILAMNPYATSTADSELVIHIQKKLLWLMYDGGHLRAYPMALGILGELESMEDTPETTHTALELFKEAVHIGRTMYADQHVYPYTYLGSFMFRRQEFAEALHCYANAAQVIRNFNYGREDEEIYKEFMEVNNEIIPQLVKYSGIVEDATCFAQMLRLWDGLCGWEEGSSTPVLHIGWAQPFVSVINKFPASTRKAVNIIIWENPLLQNFPSKHHGTSSITAEPKEDKKLKEIKIENEQLLASSPKGGDGKSGDCKNGPDKDLLRVRERSHTPTRRGSQSRKSRANTQQDAKCEKDISGRCGASSLIEKDVNGSPITKGVDAASQDTNENDTKKETRREETPAPAKVTEEERAFRVDREKRSDTVVFSSQKMIGLRDLLLADKLNISAIQLQLTAQSHLVTKHKLDDDNRRTSKRGRRE